MTFIPATFIGFWELGGTHLKLWNLLQEIPGHPVHSSVTCSTLRTEGYMPFDPHVEYLDTLHRRT